MYSALMDTVNDVFREFGGPTALGRAIGVNPSTASEMRRRRSIPVDYWPRLVAAAHERGIDGLDYKTLVEMHAPEQAVPQ